MPGSAAAGVAIATTVNSAAKHPKPMRDRPYVAARTLGMTAPLDCRDRCARFGGTLSQGQSATYQATQIIARSGIRLHRRFTVSLGGLRGRRSSRTDGHRRRSTAVPIALMEDRVHGASGCS